MLSQYYAGALLRRDFRVLLRRLEFEYKGFSWTEEKALLDSIFIVKGNRTAIKVLDGIVRSYGRSR